ncbi:MAG: hypothetical protein ACTSPB_00030 [Candidatus Thorarchaeota archaeon]
MRTEPTFEEIINNSIVSLERKTQEFKEDIIRCVEDDNWDKARELLNRMLEYEDEIVIKRSVLITYDVVMKKECE